VPKRLATKRFIGPERIGLPAVVVLRADYVPTKHVLAAVAAVALSTALLGPIAGALVALSSYPIFVRFAFLVPDGSSQKVAVYSVLSGDVNYLTTKFSVE